MVGFSFLMEQPQHQAATPYSPPHRSRACTNSSSVREPYTYMHVQFSPKQHTCTQTLTQNSLQHHIHPSHLARAPVGTARDNTPLATPSPAKEDLGLADGGTATKASDPPREASHTNEVQATAFFIINLYDDGALPRVCCWLSLSLENRTRFVLCVSRCPLCDQATLTSWNGLGEKDRCCRQGGGRRYLQDVYTALLQLLYVCAAAKRGSRTHKT